MMVIVHRDCIVKKIWSGNLSIFSLLKIGFIKYLSSIFCGITYGSCCCVFNASFLFKTIDFCFFVYITSWAEKMRKYSKDYLSLEYSLPRLPNAASC